jgi:DNA-directed RNA polymerase specialized sigma24 family protein
MTDHPISEWIQQVKKGENSYAQQKLGSFYFSQLADYARRRLGGVPYGLGDGEDVALSALDSFLSAARDGKFPLITDRTDLWPLLMTITRNKAINLREKAGAKKRGGGKVRGESALGDPDDEKARGVQHVPGNEPTPEFVVEMAEECDRLLAILSEKHRFIAERRLEGFSCKEIADQLGCSKRTVNRLVDDIRKYWKKDSAGSM